jgi:hypothetical protein
LMTNVLHGNKLTFIGNMEGYVCPDNWVLGHPMFSNEPTTDVYTTHWDLATTDLVLDVFWLY